MTAALALAQTNAGVLLLSPKPKRIPSMPITLRYDQRDFLKSLGVWQDLEPETQAIDTLVLGWITSDHTPTIHAHEWGDEPLAYTMSMDTLYQRLQKAVIEHPGIEVIEKEVHDLTPLWKKQTMPVWSIQTSARTFHAQRVLLAEGEQRTLAQRLGLGVNAHASRFESCVFRVKQTLSQQANQAMQYVAGDAVMGLIPDSQSDTQWLIATYSDTGPWKRMSDAVKKDRISEFFFQKGRTVSYVNDLVFCKSSGLSYQATSTLPGLLCIGQGRVSLPPLGAQGLNRAWDELKHLQAMQQRCPWHTADDVDWQKHVQSRWDAEMRPWYRLLSRAMPYMAEEQQAWMMQASGVLWDAAFYLGVQKRLLMFYGGVLPHQGQIAKGIGARYTELAGMVSHRWCV